MSLPASSLGVCTRHHPLPAVGWMLAIGLACWMAAAAPARAEDAFFDKLLTLGTGTQGSAFLPIGESLCDAVNPQRQSQRIRCVATPTAGSIYNINAVNNGRLQLGLVQEDQVVDHLAGSNGGEYHDLRLVAVMHLSPVSVIVRRSANVEQLAQIRGLRINMGSRGSGQFTVSAGLIQALGLTEADFPVVRHEPTDAFEKIFCGGTVDLVVEVVPHPVAVIEKLLACGGRFLEIPPDVIEALIKRNPAFRPMTIHGGIYKGLPESVLSVGVRNLLISHTRVSAESVARLTRMLWQQTPALRQQQPLLATMPPLSTGRDSVEAQRMLMHEGALRAVLQ